MWKFWAFMALWIPLVLFNIWFTYYYENPRVKRVGYPLLVIVSAVLFAAFPVWMGVPFWALFILLPVVALIAALNLKLRAVCPSCGHLTFRHNLVEELGYCPRCGGRIE